MAVPQLLPPRSQQGPGPGPSRGGPLLPLRNAVQSGMARARQTSAAVAGSVRSFNAKQAAGNLAKRASSGVQSVSSGTSRLVARIERNDSIGKVFLGAAPLATASGVQGIVNATPIGEKLKEVTGLDASTFVAGFGALARWAGFDKKWPKLRAANTFQIQAEVTVLARKVGSRVPGALRAFLDPSGGGAPSFLSKMWRGSTPNVQGYEPRPDPGGSEQNPAPAKQNETRVQEEVPIPADV